MDFSKLTVFDLKKQLKERGCSTKGIKKELVDRLIANQNQNKTTPLKTSLVLRSRQHCSPKMNNLKEGNPKMRNLQIRLEILDKRTIDACRNGTFIITDAMRIKSVDVASANAAADSADVVSNKNKQQSALLPETKPLKTSRISQLTQQCSPKTDDSKKIADEMIEKSVEVASTDSSDVASANSATDSSDTASDVASTKIIQQSSRILRSRTIQLKSPQIKSKLPNGTCVELQLNSKKRRLNIQPQILQPQNSIVSNEVRTPTRNRRSRKVVANILVMQPAFGMR